MHGDDFDRMCREVAAKLNGGAWRATTGPRMSVIFDGVEAGFAHPQILSAYRVLYEDYTMFRLSARLLFKIFMSALKTR